MVFFVFFLYSNFVLGLVLFGVALRFVDGPYYNIIYNIL